MNRLVLQVLNAPALILITVIAIALQTSLFNSWPLQYFQPDIILLVVVWCGLHRSFTEGGIITLLIGNFAELHSAAPQGLFLIGYMTVYLMVRGAERLVVISHLSSLIMLTLFSSVVWKLTTLGVLHLLAASANQWKHTLIFLFPGAVIEGTLAFWVYRWLEKFDYFTYKSARDEDNLENELQLHGG